MDLKEVTKNKGDANVGHMPKETITIDGKDRTLSRGSGNPKMATLLEVVGEEFDDTPECVSHVLAAFVRALWALDPGSAELAPFVDRLIGTNGRPDLEHKAAMMCLDWAVRIGPTAWLRAIGLDQTATELGALPTISSWEQMSRSKPVLSAALYAARGRLDKSTRREMTVVHFSGAYAPWAAAWKAAQLQDMQRWEDRWYSTWRAMAVACRVMPLQDASRLALATHSEVVQLLDRIIKLWGR